MKIRKQRVSDSFVYTLAVILTFGFARILRIIITRAIQKALED